MLHDYLEECIDGASKQLKIYGYDDWKLFITDSWDRSVNEAIRGLMQFRIGTVHQSDVNPEGCIFASFKKTNKGRSAKINDGWPKG